MDAAAVSTEHDQEEFITKQVQKVQEVLDLNADQLLLLVRQRMQSLFQAASNQRVQEIAELRMENERLQAEVHLTGGTGGSPQPANSRRTWPVNARHSQSTTSTKPEQLRVPFPPDDEDITSIKLEQPPVHLSPNARPADDPSIDSTFLTASADSSIAYVVGQSASPFRRDAWNEKNGKTTSFEKIGKTTSFGSCAELPGSPTSSALRTRISKESGVSLPRGERLSKPMPPMTRRQTVRMLKSPAHGPDKTSGKRHSGKPRAVFADVTALKEQVRETVAKKEYNVCDSYWDTGYAQQIARSQMFEYITLAVIAFNALWIAIEADYNLAVSMVDAEPIFQLAGNGFCLYFSFEWLVRFLSFREKPQCLRDSWFIFDTVLVLLMIVETWIASLFMLVARGGDSSVQNNGNNMSFLKIMRLARLARMGRLARLLRAVPELVILVKGIGVAARSVFFTLILLLLLIYFFAIVCRQLLDDTEVGAQYFPSVPESMSSLLLGAVLPDQAAIVTDCAGESLIFGIVILFFILGSTLTVMNMLVGVLCEVVSVVSAVEKEQLTVNYVKSKLFAMFGEWDTDGSMTIDKNEFHQLLLMPEAARMINEVGVDVVGLFDFCDFIFKDEDDLTYSDFVELVLSFRGSNHSTVKDIVDLRKFVHSEMTTTKQDLALVLTEFKNALDEKVKLDVPTVLKRDELPVLLNSPEAPLYSSEISFPVLLPGPDHGSRHAIASSASSPCSSSAALPTMEDMGAPNIGSLPHADSRLSLPGPPSAVPLPPSQSRLQSRLHVAAMGEDVDVSLLLTEFDISSPLGNSRG